MIHRFSENCHNWGSGEVARRTEDRNYMEVSKYSLLMVATLSFAPYFLFLSNTSIIFGKKKLLLLLSLCINMVDIDPRNKYTDFIQVRTEEKKSQFKWRHFYHDFVTFRYYDNRIKSQFRLICDDSIGV